MLSRQKRNRLAEAIAAELDGRRPELSSADKLVIVGSVIAGIIGGLPEGLRGIAIEDHLTLLSRTFPDFLAPPEEVIAAPEVASPSPPLLCLCHLPAPQCAYPSCGAGARIKKTPHPGTAQ